MVFGITTGKAHLNVLDPTVVEPEEIKWNDFLTWNNGSKPKFAGRYFLGQPYLWAHGEGSETKGQVDIERIVPIQRSDPDHQKAKDEEGDLYGFEDAQALCEYLDKCIQMGELKITNTFVHVFLDVADGTELSTEYWSSWSAAVHDHIYVGEKSITVGGNTISVPTLSNPYQPCICCRFVKAGGASPKYVPEQKVLDCLSNTGKNLAGSQTRCYGFWARATDNPAYHVPQPALDWSNFEVYRQPQGSTDQPVWLLLWRYKDATNINPPDVPEGDKLTLDTANEPVEQAKVSKFMLQIVENQSARLPPTQAGFDRGRAISQAQVKCISDKTVTIGNLPFTGVSVGPRAGVKLEPPIKDLSTFAVRYLTTPSNDPERNKDSIMPQEASDIIQNGLMLVSTWEARAEKANEHLTTPSQGIRDARLAFAIAAYILRQPAYTPIYFSIDCNVEFLFPTGILPDDVVTYFKDIWEGYLEYLEDKELDLQGVWKDYVWTNYMQGLQKKKADENLKPRPYYVGIYGPNNALAICYAKGLASHYWQAWPPRWNEGKNLYVWPHNNLWQILISQADEFWVDNKVVRDCARDYGLDLDVAWGDPGGWKF